MSKRTAIVQPLILALFLAAGVGVAWGIFAGWCWGVAQRQFPSESTKIVEVRADGVPMVKTLLPDGSYSARQTLDGQSLGSQIEIDNQAQPARLWVPSRPSFFPMRWSRRIHTFHSGGSLSVMWYFIHDGKVDGHGYFVGYDQKTKDLVGYIGEKGFRGQQPVLSECFPVTGRFPYGGFFYCAGEHFAHHGSGESSYLFPWNVYLVSADRLLRIDLRERSVHLMLEEKELISIDALRKTVLPETLKELAVQPTQPQYLVVRSADRLFTFDDEGRQQSTYPIPADLRDKTFFAYLLHDDAALLSSMRGHPGTTTEEFTWIDPEGHVVKEREVSWRRVGFFAGEGVQVASFAAVCPIPVVPIFVIIVVPLIAFGTGNASNYGQGMLLMLSDAWPAFLAIFAVATVLAVLTYRRQRRFGASWTWAWVAFVFLFGPAGFVGYWTHRRWPPRVACPNCGAAAPRDREACFACGNEFPGPVEKGIEVFA